MELTGNVAGMIKLLGSGSEVEVTPILLVGTKIAEIKVDDTTYDIFAPSGGSGGSSVEVTPTLLTGTKIADIEVDGVTKSLYAPTPGSVDVTQIQASGTKIATIDINGVSTDIYAPSPTSVSVTQVETSGTKIATINVNGVDYDIYSSDYSGDISSLQSDMTAAESIIGDGQLDIGNDLTDAVNEINQSLSQLDGLVVYRQVIPTGDTASFIASDSMQIIKLESDITPSQDLHGYDHPWAGGAGKNKFPIATASSSGAQNIFSSQSISLEANTNYILSFDTSNPLTKTMSVSFNAGSTQVRGVDIPAGTSVVGMSFTQNVDNLDWYVREAVDISNIMIEEGGQKTDFAPYSNICPISGFTDIDVSLSPTLDSQDATIYTTNFVDSGSPLTVYGGYIDSIKGLLTVTDGNIASYAGESLPSTWISDRDVYTSGGTPTTGAQVVYKLASALNYQLTTQQINDLIGQNYIWADTGSIKEVGYLDILHLS